MGMTNPMLADKEQNKAQERIMPTLLQERSIKEASPSLVQCHGLLVDFKYEMCLLRHRMSENPMSPRVGITHGDSGLLVQIIHVIVLLISTFSRDIFVN